MISMRLQALEQADLDQQLGNVSFGALPDAGQGSIGSSVTDEAVLAALMPSAPMPSVPTTAVKTMTDVERELAELEASMAM